MRRIQVEWSLLIVLALFAAGCESGFSTHFHFSVGPDTTEAFSEENPGLLFMSNGDHLTPVAQLCSADALNLSVDIDGGFGCLPDSRSPTTAMVAQIPEQWDAAQFCSLQRVGGRFLVLPPDMLIPDDLAPSALSEDTVSPRLERDLSPCGGQITYSFSN